MVITPVLKSIAMESATFSLYILASLLLTAYIVYRLLNRVSIADIPGPEPESWLLGMHQRGLYPQINDLQVTIDSYFKDKWER